MATFTARAVDHTGNGTLTDGSRLFEVITPDGERIADCTSEGAALGLAKALNAELHGWFMRNTIDRNLAAEAA
jgi:hypothetical protein